jgi:crotonobetainyl-CoA:carnitine CoA-transferase CaiB-like acyl-CoA transferase
MSALIAERSVTGVRRDQQGNTNFYAAPNDLYRTKDGWILVATIGARMFRRWAEMIGRQDLVADPRLSDDISRANSHAVITEAMSAWCGARTSDEALSELEKARIPCGPAYSLGDVLSDPQVREMGFLDLHEFPGASAPIPLAATPLRFSNTAPEIRRRAPKLGEHTDEVLRELGFTDSEIEEFRRERAI